MPHSAIRVTLDGPPILAEVGSRALRAVADRLDDLGPAYDVGSLMDVVMPLAAEVERILNQEEP